MNFPVAEFISEGGIKALIQKGRKRGYLTSVEILNALPEDITDSESFEDMDLGFEVAREPLSIDE